MKKILHIYTLDFVSYPGKKSFTIHLLLRSAFSLLSKIAYTKKKKNIYNSTLFINNRKEEINICIVVLFVFIFLGIYTYIYILNIVLVHTISFWFICCKIFIQKFVHS